MDRLITELKLPPADAYHKLRHVIAEVNALVAKEYGGGAAAAGMALSPERGNVVFCSSLHGWSFTLRSFAELYALAHPDADLDAARLARRLWGDYYFHAADRRFRRTRPDGGEGGARSFVEFVLEPLYKVYSTIIGEDAAALGAVMAEFGVAMRPEELGIDVAPLLRLCCTKIFGGPAGLADAVLAAVPSVRDGNAERVRRAYTGPLPPSGADAADAAANGKGNGAGAGAAGRVGDMLSCNPDGKLMVMVTKLYPRASAAGGGGGGGGGAGKAGAASTVFDALGRVMSGTLRVGQSVRVLGEGYSPEDDEDSMVQTVSDLLLYNARYRVRLEEAPAGSLVLIGGVDKSIFKTATLCGLEGAAYGDGGGPDSPGSDDEDDGGDDDEVHIFRPLRFPTSSVVKIATEPLNPAELPKMVDGLRSINKTYPLATTKVRAHSLHSLTHSTHSLTPLTHSLTHSLARLQG